VDPNSIAPWGVDWAWGLPLIVLTVSLHVAGLSLLRRLCGRFQQLLLMCRTCSVAGVTIIIVFLHAIEATIWAGAFRALDALPDSRSAALYSLNALTAYGHTDLNLGRKWQMMGALESLNGWILFGLSAAFIFTLVQGVWAIDEPPTISSGTARSQPATHTPTRI
jgi:hypothetical protein